MAKSKLPRTTRQQIALSALGALTYAEFMDFARWLAGASENGPTERQVANMAERMQYVIDNFERG